MTKISDSQSEIVIYVGERRLLAAEAILNLQGASKVLRHACLRKPDGFQNGIVTNLQRAVFSIDEVLNQLFHGQSRPKELAVYVVLGNHDLKTFSFSSCQYYQGAHHVISSQEIRAVVNQTRSIATLPLSEFILQSIPESFLVDDTPGVRNPMGLEAQRLGVDLKIHTMNFDSFRNISRAFESAEIEVKGYFPKTVALSESLLSDSEKEEGSILLDVSHNGIYLISWKNGRLINTHYLENGSGYITEKLAAHYEIDAQDAERAKEQYATFNLDSSQAEELMPLVERNGKGAKQIKREEFHQVFLKIAQEWAEKVLKSCDELAQSENLLYPHLIFTGGGIHFDGFLEFLQKKFSREVRLGTVHKIDAAHELLVDPSWAAGLGMIRWLATNARDQEQLFAPRGIIEKTFASARDWFYAYF